MSTPDNSPQKSEVPGTFLGYLKSFGPGIIVVLTWLGAGDVVETSVAGGKYGYALMWVMVVAIGMRFLFVSLIAKYQLCNQRGEGVLDGLARIHPVYPLFLFLASIVMGHVSCAYMTVGIAEVCVNLTGVGQKWMWAVLWNGIGLAIIFRPVLGNIESLFKVLLVVLSISFVGTALWVGPDPAGILEGTFAFKLPPPSAGSDQSDGALLVAIGLIGAVGGSLMNLVYPYFLEDKGWNSPAHRKVQTYDFLLAILVMIVLNLSIWTLGAEVLHLKGQDLNEIKLDDLPQLLTGLLGRGGRVVFYVGIFAAIYSSLVGHALGLGYLGSHAYQRLTKGADAKTGDYRSHAWYRRIAVWCLVSPIIWTIPGVPEEASFVYMTLVANSAQVMLVPPIAGGLWWITANSDYIGEQYRNRWWENLVMAVLFAVAIWAAVGSLASVYESLSEVFQALVG